MTVTRRIRRRGEHEISRKTIACGNAGCSGGPVVTTLVCVTTLCARGCGCSGHPAFPTPSLGERFMHNLGASARESVNSYLELAVLRLNREFARSCFLILLRWRGWSGQPAFRARA